MGGLLEADFAQIEHVNQVIANNVSHESWECFDTALLLEQYPAYGTYDKSNPSKSTIQKEVKDVRYNSLIVNITIPDSSTYKYVFEVRNALWDGTYKITHSKDNSSDEDVVFSEDEVFVTTDDDTEGTGNIISFEISGDYRKQVRICFHMTMAGDGRTIVTNQRGIILDNDTEYTHQFNTSNDEEGYVYDERNKPLENAMISIVPCDENGVTITETTIQEGKVIPSVSDVKSDSNGKFIMTYGAVDAPGDYYVLMTALRVVNSKSYSVSQLIHVIKVQNESRGINWGNAENYKNVYKGSIHTFSPIQIIVKNKFDIRDSSRESILLNTIVDVSFITNGGKSTRETYTVEKGLDDENKTMYYIAPRISYRQYYEDYSTLRITLPAGNGFSEHVEEHKVHHSWAIVDSSDGFGKLKTFVETDPDGPDWVFVENQLKCTSTLNIQREQTIAGTIIQDSGGNLVASGIDGDNRNIIKITNDDASSEGYMNVQLIGLQLSNAQCAVYLETGCRLLVDRCVFKGNKNTGMHHRGVSIYMPSDDESVNNHLNYKCNIRNSVFYNNKGNEIQSIGYTYILNNRFITRDDGDASAKEFLQQPEVKVVRVKAGQVLYRYNKSYIKAPKPIPTNHSWAKALAYIDKGARFNGKGYNQLGKDMSLPLYGGDLQNQCYTYAIYYYPYSNVRTTITCSPRRGYERKATGHASAYKNWCYYDGYYFLRYNNGKNKGNTYDPWTTEEKSVPQNTGIYDVDNDKFLDNYDPRISNNYSLNASHITMYGVGW